MMQSAKWLVIAGLSYLVSGCGTYVPSIAEAPVSPGVEQKLVGDIVESIHCEVRKAVNFVLHPPNADTYPKWFDKWGVQIALTLTIVEKTQLNSNIVGLPPSPATAVLTLAGSGTLSSEATRVSKLSFFYAVKDLNNLGLCRRPNLERSPEAPLIQSDLGLQTWLSDQVTVSAFGPVIFPVSSKGVFGKDVISHNVRFQLISSGSIAPSLKLVRATLNDAAPLATISRDRTHDLLMTFGPIDPSEPYSLVRTAENQHLASQIGIAVANYSRINSDLR